MIIFGAGGHGKVIIDCLESLTAESSATQIEAVIDEKFSKKQIYQYPVYHNYSPDFLPHSQVIIAIGDNTVRKNIAIKIAHQSGNIIHPSALVSPKCNIGEGTVILHKAIVQADVNLGKHVIVNTLALVEHDCFVEDYAHIGPRATLCGNVQVGEGTLVGAGAIVLPGIKIGKWAIIGAGAIVSKDVKNFKTIIGQPTVFQNHPQEPDTVNKIYISPPHLGNQEIQKVFNVFTSNWIAPAGKALSEFEEKVCQATGARYALAVSSGTAAIHLALQVLGVGSYDEVICPTFTFAATVNPILYQGATPVFLDCEAETWNINPHQLERAILSGINRKKKPKVIIVAHCYGMPARMQEIMAIASQYQIPVIEDAAAALGSTYNGKHIGTFGQMGIYSFNGNKIITTGGGGVLVSDKAEFIEKARFLASQAYTRSNYPYYHWDEIGYNYRMSNLLAAVGVGQLELLEERIGARRGIFDFYRQNLSDKSNENLSFQTEPDNHYSNRWLTCLLLDRSEPEHLISTTKIREALHCEGIESRFLWQPLHLQPIYQKYLYFGEQTAEKLFKKGLALPSGSNLHEIQLRKIANIILKAIDYL